MNCCNDYGQCTQGPGCPARETPMNANLARRANERIRRLEAGRAHLLTLADTPSLRIRVWDWVGNLPHRFGRWVDRSSAGNRLCLAIGAILAAAVVVGVGK